MLKHLCWLLSLLLSLGLFAQEFSSLSLKDGQIKGISYVTTGTEKTARPVIWVHGTLETAERWKEFMREYPDLNHYAVNLPMHGIGENITHLKGANDYRSFYEDALPAIIEHVYKTTGQRPIVVGYSIGAKTVHDTLVKVPGMRDKVEGVVEIMRPNQIGENVPLPKSPLKVSKPLLGISKHTPTMPDIDLVRKTSAQLLPALPDGIYTHLEGTEISQIEKYLLESQSTQIGNELNKDFIEMLNTEFSHTDHGKPIWFVWADNDLICPGGERAFNELVQLRVTEYVKNVPEYGQFTEVQRQAKIKELAKLVKERKFPPGFTPIYGTSMGKAGHVGAVIPGSAAGKVLNKGVHDLATEGEVTIESKVRFKVSPQNGIFGCAKDKLFQVLNFLLKK